MGLSEAMNEAWTDFNDSKPELTKRDRGEIYEILSEIKEELDRAWELYREAADRKQSEWRARKEEEAERLREKITKAYAARAKIEDNRDRNVDKLSDARSDDYADRVRGWIEEDEAKLRDIDENISRWEGWLEEIEEKLRGR